MSTTIKTLPGDDYDTISRRAYGLTSEARRIREANPGVSEPLQIGVDVIVPDLPDAPPNAELIASTTPDDEVAVLINNKRFRFWDSAVITQVIDSFDTVELSAPMESDNLEFRKAFRPLSFDSIVVSVGGKPFFTGVIVNVLPEINPKSRVVRVSAYALPGVLNDCTPPASVYPAQEFNGQGFRDIARSIAGWYGLGVTFDANQGAVFDTVECEVDRSVLSFLIDLAQQRNLIISNTLTGKLLVTQSVDKGSPVATLRQGESPLISVVPQFKPQRYFSHITGLAPESIENDGSQFTLRNTRLKNVIRPLTFMARDTDSTNVREAVKSKIGRMFGAVVSYRLDVNTWNDPNGELWLVNTTIILLAPDAMVYKPFEFIIRTVSFSVDSSSRMATLDLVLPGTFSGELPESLPWDE